MKVEDHKNDNPLRSYKVSQRLTQQTTVLEINRSTFKNQESSSNQNLRPSSPEISQNSPRFKLDTPNINKLNLSSPHNTQLLARSNRYQDNSRPSSPEIVPQLPQSCERTKRDPFAINLPSLEEEDPVVSALRLEWMRVAEGIQWPEEVEKILRNEVQPFSYYEKQERKESKTIRTRPPERHGQPWSPQDDELLRRLRAEGLPWERISEEIRKQLGISRTPSACSQRFGKLRKQLSESQTTHHPSKQAKAKLLR